MNSLSTNNSNLLEMFQTNTQKSKRNNLSCILYNDHDGTFNLGQWFLEDNLMLLIKTENCTISATTTAFVIFLLSVQIF